jgi:hypothetical protein
MNTLKSSDTLEILHTLDNHRVWQTSAGDFSRSYKYRIHVHAARIHAAQDVIKSVLFVTWA